MVVVYLKSWARSGLFKESEREGSRGGTRTRTSGRWSFTSRPLFLTIFWILFFWILFFVFFFFNSLVKATSEKKTITFFLASFIRTIQKMQFFAHNILTFWPLAFSLVEVLLFGHNILEPFHFAIYIYIKGSSYIRYNLNFDKFTIRLYYFCLFFILAKFLDD